MRQGASSIRQSFNSFYRSFLGLVRTCFDRAIRPAAAISCVPIISHLESRPLPPFQSLPFRSHPKEPSSKETGGKTINTKFLILDNVKSGHPVDAEYTEDSF